MRKEVIEKIISLSDDVQIKVGNFDFIKHGYEKVTPPNVNALFVRTLRGFTDFINNFKAPEGEELMIAINDHHSAELVGKIDPIYGNRQLYCQAKININMPDFNEWRDPEYFNIFMQVFFEDKGDKSKVLNVMSNVTNAASSETSDDGAKQSVVVRKGITMKDNAVVPNPCTLAPKRTFAEIDQPESKFILRVKERNGVQIRLFEADGGQYKLDAIQGMKDYISENLADGVKIPIIG